MAVGGGDGGSGYLMNGILCFATTAIQSMERWDNRYNTLNVVMNEWNE